jgi:hypothetical protein
LPLKGKPFAYVVFGCGIVLALLGLAGLLDLIAINQIQPSAMLSLYIATCFGGIAMAVAGASFISSATIHEKLDKLLAK